MRRDSAPAVIALALATIGIGSGLLSASGGRSAIDPGTMPKAGVVDARFQSYNVEMAEVTGGNFWKPYARGSQSAAAASPAAPRSGGSGAQPAGLDPSLFQARPPIDLAVARLRMLAAALGPAYVRASGSWANMVYFHDADTQPPASAPKGFQGVLTRPQWKGVVDFARAVNAQLVSSFTVSEGVRDAAGIWTPDQARRFLAFTTAAGGRIAAAEFFNEPNLPSYGGAPKGYSASDFARDYAVFRQFARAAAPDMRLVGPGSVGEGTMMSADQRPPMPGLIKSEELLSATPRPVFDIFSYHHYGAVSQRCASMGAGQTTPAAALSEEWFARTDASFKVYGSLRDQFAPGAPIWITETADAACGGNPWATSFLDTFRYLDQLGRLAKRGVSVVFHNTLAASEYGLLDQATFAPRPNYWGGLLWHRLMGTTVLDAGASPPDVRLYAHCLPGRPGGVTLLAINTSTEEQPLELAKPAQRYTLSAPTLESPEVQLNGRPLTLRPGDALPDFEATPAAAGTLKLAARTITFLAVSGAGNNACAAR